MSLSPDNQSVEAGSEVAVNVYVEPDLPISGMQFDLHFDGSVLDVKSVSEGDLFSNTATTFFSEGTIDNKAGSIIYAHSVILGKDEVTSPGILATIVFEATGPGRSELQMSNVVVSNSTGSAVPISVNDAVVTVSATSSAGADSGSTVSGSGGGGGAGDSGEPFENIALKEVAERTVVMGMNQSYTFNNTDNPVVSVNFTPLRNAGPITTTVEVLEDRSALVSDNPDGLVYRNMNIWVGKYGFATPANIEAMVVGFRVENSWMEANGVKSSAIRLNRYSDGKWQALQTMFTDEMDGYAYFESPTPGFSPFAITAVAETSVTSETGAEGDSAIDRNDDQTLSQNTVLVLLIVFLFVAVKRGRDI